MRWRTAALLLALATSGPGQAAALDLPALAERQGICALAVVALVAGQAQPVQEVRRCEPERGSAAPAVYMAASLSKPVFAYAVLKLAAAGGIDLDAPLWPFLPAEERARPQPPELQQLTPRQVLMHTTGLPNWAGGPLRFSFAPGSRWQYSGEGYVLLQRAVQGITGQDLDAFVRAQVFEPLAMQDSAFVSNERIAGRVLPGRGVDGGAFGPPRITRGNAAASLHTTAADYARFVAAVVADRRLLELLQRQPVEVDAALTLSWGLGWGLEGAAAPRWLWQWGNNPGYRAFVMVSSASGDGIVMLSNSERGMAALPTLMAALLPGDHPVLRSRYLRAPALPAPESMAP